MERETLEFRRRKAFLASAVAGNRAIAQFCPEVGAEYVPVAGGYAFFRGVKDPATRAIEIGSLGTVMEEQIDELEKFFRSRNAKVSLFVSNESAARQLIQMLEKRDYERGPTLGTWWRALPASELRPVPDDVTVSCVGLEQVETWARTVAAGFRENNAPITEDDIEPWEVCHFCARASAENCQPYLAVRSGEPVGGGMLQTLDGVALIMTASTRFTHRRNGVQSALITERLRAASDAGCELAFSVADKGGASERNLHRFGFMLLQEGCIMSNP